MDNISTELYKIRLEVRMNKVGTNVWFNSEEKVNFYTGLPNSYVLMTVCEFVSSGMEHSSNPVFRVHNDLDAVSIKPDHC